MLVTNKNTCKDVDKDIDVYRFSFYEIDSSYYCYLFLSNKCLDSLETCLQDSLQTTLQDSKILKVDIPHSFYTACIEKNIYKINMVLSNTSDIYEPSIFLTIYATDIFLVRQNKLSAFSKTFQYISLIEYIKECI